VAVAVVVEVQVLAKAVAVVEVVAVLLQVNYLLADEFMYTLAQEVPLVLQIKLETTLGLVMVETLI
jgi:hypothetical protein